MNSHTSAEVKGQSIGLVTAIVDGESQSSKEVMNYVLLLIVWKDPFLGYPCGCSSDSWAVIEPFSCTIQQWGPEPRQLSTGVVCWKTIRINLVLI